MNYKVTPGLYAVGKPTDIAPVLVTANYKMSFDYLRRELEGIDCWVLVLDTEGINVWCAAGKGTFGTEELINKIESVNLKQYVSHNSLIVPQLGAVGVAGYEVTQRTGFSVVFGPVRAADIPAFIERGMEATDEMRTVRFDFTDRLSVVPMEIVSALNPTFCVLGVMFLLNVIGATSFNGMDVASLLGAVFLGGVVVPAFLPWIPFRAFALKGWLAGTIYAFGIIMFNGFFENRELWLKVAEYLLLLPAISAFFAMCFTGATTFTSLSGVQKEMKIATPGIFVSICIGLFVVLIDIFI